MNTRSETLSQSLQRLYSRQAFGIKLGLETENEILELLGRPERCFVSIHVAGTNGKGSVCAMIESVLRAAGYRTGLYISPHLIRFNERIRTGGECVTDAELVGLLNVVEPLVEKAASSPGGREATFFEITTAMAFEHFRRKAVQVAVLETGMGGRLDATNVVTPLLSVITTISLEHTAYLGPDIATIAGEKAGIIKPGRPVVCADMPDEAIGVIERTARERGARFVRASESVSVRRVSQTLAGQKVNVQSAQTEYGAMLLPLLGRHQLGNCAAAVAALEEAATATGVPMSTDRVRAGLQSTRWPGRCQVVSQEPIMLVDGAHNPGAAAVLAATLKELLKGRKIGLVLGMCGDKDARGVLRAFAGLIDRCWVVPIRTERAVPVVGLAKLARGFRFETEESALDAALAGAREWALAEGGAICITGSLFLAGEVLELLAVPV